MRARLECAPLSIPPSPRGPFFPEFGKQGAPTFFAAVASAWCTYARRKAARAPRASAAVRDRGREGGAPKSGLAHGLAHRAQMALQSDQEAR